MKKSALAPKSFCSEIWACPSTESRILLVSSLLTRICGTMVNTSHMMWLFQARPAYTEIVTRRIHGDLAEPQSTPPPNVHFPRSATAARTRTCTTCPPVRAIATPTPNESPGTGFASSGIGTLHRQPACIRSDLPRRLRAMRKFVRRFIEKIMVCSWSWGVGSFVHTYCFSGEEWRVGLQKKNGRFVRCIVRLARSVACALGGVRVRRSVACSISITCTLGEV